jgi:serpin B
MWTAASVWIRAHCRVASGAVWFFAVVSTLWYLPGGADRRVAAMGSQAELGDPRTGKFAGELYRELARAEGNLVFSPWSASKSLEMALAGARGSTEQEIRLVLGSEAGAKSPGQSVEARSTTSGAGARLTVASSVWTETRIPVAESFRLALLHAFHAELRKAPFHEQPLAAAREVNSWVAEATRGEIRELFPGGQGINSSTQLLIANAVSFEAAWHSPFQKRATRSERFTIDGKRGLDVPMMHQAGRFPYAEDARAQYLELPYADPRYALLLILPRPETRLADVEHNLFEVFREKPVFGLLECAVRIAVPRFTIRSRLDMRQPLTTLGVRSAFTAGQADLSGMVEGGGRDLSISAILQEALIEVNEAGSRATAATGLSAGITSTESVKEVKSFRADRPFEFAILEKNDRIVLFAGRLVSPHGGDHE